MLQKDVHIILVSAAGLAHLAISGFLLGYTKYEELIVHVLQPYSKGNLRLSFPEEHGISCTTPWILCILKSHVVMLSAMIIIIQPVGNIFIT